MVENWTSGGLGDSGETPDSPVSARGADVCRITKIDYLGPTGLITKRTALDPACDGDGTGHTADNQVTRYVYAAEITGVARDKQFGGYLCVGAGLRAVTYPDGETEANVIAETAYPLDSTRPNW